jgi:hypothetical protein
MNFMKKISLYLIKLLIFNLFCFSQHESVFELKNIEYLKTIDNTYGDVIVTQFGDTLVCKIEEITTETIIYLADGIEQFMFRSEIVYYYINEENEEFIEE